MSIINSSNFTSGFSNYWNNNIEEKSLGERFKIVEDIVVNLEVLQNLNNGEKLSFGSDGKISTDQNNWSRTFRGPLTKVTALIIETNSDDISNLKGFVDSIANFVSKYALPQDQINFMIVKLQLAAQGLSKLKLLYENENKIFNSALVNEVQDNLNLVNKFTSLDANYYIQTIRNLKDKGLNKNEIIEKIKFDLYSDQSFPSYNFGNILGKVINNLDSFIYDKEVICSIAAEGIVSGHFSSNEENYNNEQALIALNSQLEERKKHHLTLLRDSNLFPVTVALIESRNKKPANDIQEQDIQEQDTESDPNVANTYTNCVATAAQATTEVWFYRAYNYFTR